MMRHCCNALCNHEQPFADIGREKQHIVCAVSFLIVVGDVIDQR